MKQRIVLCMFFFMLLAVTAGAQDVILEEDFDTDLSQWTIMMEEAPDDILITNTPAYRGDGALTLDYQNPEKYLYLRRDFPGSTDILVRIFFYDNLDLTLGSIVEITDSTETYETGLGLVTSLYPDTYALRINTLADTKDTRIPRSEGWHMFEFIVTGSGTYAKIDNTLVSESNPLQTDAGAVHLVATWELTGETAYDELSVVKADTRQWKEQVYGVLGTYYDTYKDTDFSGLYPNLGLAKHHSNDLRNILDTASSFYIYGKYTGNQEAVNRGKQLFLDAYTHAHWNNTNDWARGIYSAHFTRAAYLMWDELDSVTRQGAKQIIFDQAAHYLNRMPEGGHVFDTKAEENAWHADFLATVVNLFPDVPDKALLEDKAKCFAYHSITTSQDGAYCGISTQTVYDDFTLENHGLVNPVYAVGTLHFLGSGAMAYELAGRPVPVEFKHNTAELHDNFLNQHIDYNTFYPKDTPPLDWSGVHNTLYYGVYVFGYADEPLGYSPGFSMDDFMSKRSIFFHDIVAEWHKDGPPSAIEYFDQTQVEHSSYRWFLDSVNAVAHAQTAYMLDAALPQTCAEQDGDICAADEVCPDNLLNASDSDLCCSTECEADNIFDLDNDGSVDISDILVLVGHWGETSGGTGDLNNDNKVDIRDLVLLARNIGN